MHLEFPHTKKFSVLTAILVVITIITGYFTYNNTRPEKDYPHITGQLTYLSEKMGNLPYRDPGMYRYVKIKNYPYPFEVYADEEGKRMDSLKIGETVTAYFYETDNTREIKINRFLQFLEQDNKLYFKRRSFTENLGYFMLLLAFGCFCLIYTLYKAGKIPY